MRFLKISSAILNYITCITKRVQNHRRPQKPSGCVKMVNFVVSNVSADTQERIRVSDAQITISSIYGTGTGSVNVSRHVQLARMYWFQWRIYASVIKPTLVQIIMIIWINAGILLIRHLGTNFSEILMEVHISSFKKKHSKISFCLGLNLFIADEEENTCLNLLSVSCLLIAQGHIKAITKLCVLLQYQGNLSRRFPIIKTRLSKTVLPLQWASPYWHDAIFILKQSFGPVQIWGLEWKGCFEYLINKFIIKVIISCRFAG